MSGGGYFGNKYFPDGYFPESYFGTVGEADPNAMRGTAAGAATVTGSLTGIGEGSLVGSAAGVATVSGTLTGVGETVPQPQPVRGSGGGFWVGHSDDGVIPLRALGLKLPLPVLGRPEASGPLPLAASTAVLPLPTFGRPRLRQDDLGEILEVLEIERVLRLLRAA